MATSYTADNKLVLIYMPTLYRPTHSNVPSVSGVKRTINGQHVLALLAFIVAASFTDSTVAYFIQGTIQLKLGVVRWWQIKVHIQFICMLVVIKHELAKYSELNFTAA